MAEDQAPANKAGDANIEQRGLITDTALALITGGAAGTANALVSNKLSQSSGQGDSGRGQDSGPPAEE